MESRLHRSFRAVVMAIVASTITAACGGGVTSADTPDVSISAGTSSIELVPGGANFIVFSVVRSGGYTGTVDLATVNVPQGITAVFDPPKVVAGALVSSLRISVAPLTPAGTYTIMTRASGSGVSATTAPFTIVVAVPTITIATGVTSASLEQGKTLTIPITLTRSAGYNGTVGLTAVGLPSGVTAAITPASLTAGMSTATLTLTATLQAQLGEKQILVQADADGAADRTVPVQLTVTPNTSPAVLVSAEPTFVEVIRGQAATATVNIERLAGFNGEVNITVDGLPDNIVALASPIAPGSYSTQLTFNVGVEAAVAINAVQIRATGNGIAPAMTTFGLRVLELPGFRFSFPSSPGFPGGTNQVSVGAQRGQARPISGGLVRFSGFAEEVTVTAQELPAGWTTTGYRW